MVAEPKAVAMARTPRLPRAVPEPATIGVCAPSGQVDATALAATLFQSMRGSRRVMP